jgi:chemotaxis signal transduction protein
MSSNSSSNSTETAKLIYFPMGELLLALPMAHVKKVINRPLAFGSGLSAASVATIDDIQLPLIDVHRLLFQQPLPIVPDQLGYLIMVRLNPAELLGIPVQETPVLLDVPLTAIRALPDSYRQSDTLSIASHLVRLVTEGSEQTLFLVDVQRLWGLARTQFASKQPAMAG